jgi:hypothetical protein
MLKTSTMTTTEDYHTENAIKRRKYDHDHTDDEAMESMEYTPTQGWNLLQPILEKDVVCAKVPTPDVAFELLAKWFQIIAGDQDKLRLFRQWIMTSSEGESTSSSKPSPSPNQLVPCTVKLVDPKTESDEPADDVPTSSEPIKIITTIDTSPSKATSIDYINNEIPITPRSTPQVLLLQQLLQQQQQQIVMLQKLQPGSDATAVMVPTANSITVSPPSGSAGVVLTVNMKKDNQWHSFSETCACTCGFTTLDGVVTTSQRIPGGGEGEMRFVVPPISFPAQDVTQIQMAVHLTLCSAPHAPLVCADSFMYGRERAMSSDEDSEDTPDSSVCDDEENDDECSERETTTSSTSPKQLMTVRERMLDFIQASVNNTNKSTARIILVQAPPTRVVWKNRRLDTPFKIRVDGVTLDTPATKLAVLALVVDHKGKLQIDAMENFDEECSPQGIALFHNMRMTKGTWGKEWSITFVVVVKASLATNSPVVVGMSPPCPVVVKTRKNPQVRHITRSESPSPVSFVERKPDTTIRKRNRVEDILDHPSHSSSSSPLTSSPSTSSSSSSSNSSRTTGGSHSEAMTNLLYAAEIKQQEREYRPPPMLPSSAPPSPPRSMMLPSLQSGFGSPDPNFANLQGLLGYLEEIKIKHHPSLNIMEQPQLKRDGKVLIVKKGKPFRTPFRLQMRTTPPPHTSSSRPNYNTQTPEYNPQQYVCVAVLRNDKGEEVALKNSEVLFDARGLATFSGLMVMKGTWGKSVQLTFEARWSGARRIVGGSNWPPLRMLVVSETPALQLMCYTKDKKTPSAV